MRKPLSILIFLLSGLALSSELPWIGVSLNPAKEEERKAVDLDNEIGFSVSRVISGGPLDRVGGQVGDLWWKFDGQFLINKRQIVILLRAKSPGDVVKVAFFRNGSLKTLDLTLGEPQRKKTYLVSSQAHSSPDCSRVLTKREQVARLSIRGHDLSLRREGVGWRFEVLKDGTSVLSSLVTGSDIGEKIPSKWQDSYNILQLTLGNPPEERPASAGQRIRYVPRGDKTSTK